MNIGICTTDFTCDRADTIFGKMSELGVNVTQFAFASVAECEFVPDDHIELPERIPVAAMNAIIKASDMHGVEITAVNGTYNMTHPDAEVRAEGLKRFVGFAKAAKELGASTITLCSGTRSTVSLWSPHPDNSSDAAWYDMSESMKGVCEIAERYDMTLAIETEAANIIDTAERARKIMDDTGSDKLKMIMDAANLFHAGEAKRENVERVMTHAFELFGRDIRIAHGKDIRESDGIDFCATGEGIIDFELFAKLLSKYECQCDFMLHGIYDEAKMPGAIELARKYIG